MQRIEKLAGGLRAEQRPAEGRIHHLPMGEEGERPAAGALLERLPLAHHPPPGVGLLGRSLQLA